MATEDWIQESLARLESLEEERKKHEDALESASDPATLRMHTQAIDRLEVKIRALYAELEAVAAEGDGGDEVADDEVEDDSTVSAPEPAPVHAAPPAASPLAAAPAASPFGSAPAAAPFSSAPASPFGDAPAASPFGSAPAESPSFTAPPAASYDIDDTEAAGGSGSKIGLIIGLVVVLAGAGAYFVFGNKPAEEAAPPPPPTEIKVIKSGEIPPDTQGPRAAQAGDIEFTQGAQIKETDRRPSGGGGGGGGGGSSSAPSTSEPKKKKDDRTKIESTDDPLAGIR